MGQLIFYDKTQSIWARVEVKIYVIINEYQETRYYLTLRVCVNWEITVLRTLIKIIVQ